MEESHYCTYFYKSRPLTELGLEFRNLLFWNAPFWVLQIICTHFMLVTCVWKRKCKYTFLGVSVYARVQQPASSWGLGSSGITSMDHKSTGRGVSVSGYLCMRRMQLPSGGALRAASPSNLTYPTMPQS